MCPVLRFCQMIVAAVAALAQTASVSEMPSGLIHADMAGWQGTPAIGQLTVRATDGSLSSCGYDNRSWFDRAHERISVSKLIPGDRLEVLADRKPGQQVCYVRIVHVLDPAVSARLRRTPPAVKQPPPPPLTRGDRDISGAVIGRNGPALFLKTRDGDTAVLLRPDTAYFGDGIRVDASALSVNTRVYIRAGRNLDGQVEAYRVMWGNIVDPTQ